VIKDRTDVLVIGAGIAGLLCGYELQRCGLNVRVLDKARGVGGRMATRRLGGGRADHGAQFFTVREQRFRGYVDEWLNAGVIREWFRHSKVDHHPDGHPRYVGVDGMHAVPKFLASGMDVRCEQLVNRVVRVPGGWEAYTDSGAQYAAAELVLALPLPQILALLHVSRVPLPAEYRSQLSALRYEKALAALLVLEGGSEVPEPGFVRFSDGRLTWIADNYQKGISPAVTTLTLHSSPEFAHAYWDAEDSLRGALMVEAAQPFIGSAVKAVAIHRWAFTLPVEPLSQPLVSLPELQLTLAGDAFGGPRVEGAALSGICAADALSGQLV